MTLIDRLGADLPRTPVTVELDDIQATVLRYRPEPYYGTHVMLHVDDVQAGRDFLRRLTPHVDSAAGWWQAGQSWISVAVSYAGLVALGVPEDSLRSFPEAFRIGMAARAGQLLDDGENDPAHWDAPFGSGLIHLGVSVFSDSESTWRQTMEMARRQYRCRSPTCSDATAHSPGCANTSPASGRSTASCESMPRPSRSGNCWRPSWSAAGAAARP
jgi:hypothetical protein